MTDSHLRELERRYRNSGSVDDGAAWLRARVQAGELPEPRLHFAAKCGHPTALAASPGSSAWEPPQLEAFDDPDLQAQMTATGYWEGQTAEDWAYAVADEGREASLVAVRALLAQGLCSPTDVETIDELDADWVEGCHEFLGHIFSTAGESHSAKTVIETTRAALVPWALGEP